MFAENGGNGILRSERFLSADAEPPRLVGREKEIHAIRDGVLPLTKQQTPETLLIYGPPGSGKTECVNHVFNALERETRVKPVKINCWQYSTRSAFLTELLIQLGYPAPRKGKSVDRLLQIIGNWLDRNRCVAVALDEFDQLVDKTEIVYDLHMLSQQSENKIGLVMVSNIPPEEYVLDKRSWSRLSSHAIEFKPYTQQELEAILEDRVEQAFQPGAVQPEVIEQVAEDVAKAGGDCREAFEQLLQAGRQAERAGVRELTTQFLEEGEG